MNYYIIFLLLDLVSFFMIKMIWNSAREIARVYSVKTKIFVSKIRQYFDQREILTFMKSTMKRARKWKIIEKMDIKLEKIISRKKRVKRYIQRVPQNNCA